MGLRAKTHCRTSANCWSNEGSNTIHTCLFNDIQVELLIENV